MNLNSKNQIMNTEIPSTEQRSLPQINSMKNIHGDGGTLTSKNNHPGINKSLKVSGQQNQRQANNKYLINSSQPTIPDRDGNGL